MWAIITSFEFTGKRNVPVFGYKLFASDGTRSSGAGAGEFIDFDDLVWEEICRTRRQSRSRALHL